MNTQTILGAWRESQPTPQQSTMPNVSGTQPSRNMKWHCGTGGSSRGRMNYSDALANNVALIRDCMEGDPRAGPRRIKQFEHFQKEGTADDVLYLHNHTKGGVTHWGVYTGVIMSHREGFPSPPPNTNPRGWREIYGDTELECEFHIQVKKWNKLAVPFSGSGQQKTIYEAPDY